MISYLCSFLSADSEGALIINKTNFSYLLQAISVFCLQTVFAVITQSHVGVNHQMVMCIYKGDLIGYEMGS